MAANGVRPGAVIGHSMGGMTIMALAESYPDVIRDRTIAFGAIAALASTGAIDSANGGPPRSAFIDPVGP